MFVFYIVHCIFQSFSAAVYSGTLSFSVAVGTTSTDNVHSCFSTNVGVNRQQRSEVDGFIRHPNRIYDVREADKLTGSRENRTLSITAPFGKYLIFLLVRDIEVINK